MIRPEPLLFPERLDAKVVDRLRSFADLKPGWCDGGFHSTYGEPTCKEAIDWALLVCSQIVGTMIPMPSTFPTPPGGVQLEWSWGGWSIDLEMSPEGDVRGGSSAVGRTYHREFEGRAEDVVGCVRWLVSHWANLREKT